MTFVWSERMIRSRQSGEDTIKMFEGQKMLVYETPSSLIYPRKLDTALRTSTVDSFKTRIVERELKQDDHLVLFHHKVEDVLSAEQCPHLYAMLLDKVIYDSVTHGVRYTKTQVSWLRQAQTGIKTNIEIQYGWMLSNNELNTAREILKDISNKHTTEEIPLLFENIE